jgi:5-methylcytosine-specific restriction enzyme subunit McrC
METRAGERVVGRIPIKNLWLLMLYASDLTRFRGTFEMLADSEVNDLPDLVANLLSQAVERRMKRNLTRGYRERGLAMTRVKGRIDLLKTESAQYLTRGKVYCHFQEHTIDTARNQLVRGALNLMSRVVRGTELARRCGSLALSLTRAGVGAGRPSRSELQQDQITRNDGADELMIALAHLAYDLALPTEDVGATAFVAPDREESWVRRLFEKAVLGFCRMELEPIGWRVRGGVKLAWQVAESSPILQGLLPGMLTDIVLDPPNGGRRLVVDTKFTSILRAGRFSGSFLKSEYLYQMYAYLRSQEGLYEGSFETAGMFLHPAVGEQVQAQTFIQGHPFVFSTVDLTASAIEIRLELRRLLTIQL